MNDKALQSFEAKGIRVLTKQHSPPSHPHPIHMLILQVTVGRITYSIKHFTVKFIPTGSSKMYPDSTDGRNRTSILESRPAFEAGAPPGKQAGIKNGL